MLLHILDSEYLHIRYACVPLAPSLELPVLHCHSFWYQESLIMSFTYTQLSKENYMVRQNQIGRFRSNWHAKATSIGIIGIHRYIHQLCSELIDSIKSLARWWLRILEYS